MKIKIIAAGKIKGTLFDPLYRMYHKRLVWSVSLEEFESGQGAASNAPQVQRKQDTQHVLTKIPSGFSAIFLDPKGEKFSSTDFARFLEKMSVMSQKAAFIIGGAEGLDPTFYPESATQMSFGPNIWPHLLARVMLIEQIYRAQEFLSGRQYHRGRL